MDAEAKLDEPVDQMLIVYEENPEAMSFYLIPAYGKMANDVAKISGKLINIHEMTLEENIIAERLSTWIGEGDKRKKCVAMPLEGVRITRVVHTGFAM